MADTYTPNLNLTLIEVGASKDTWGQKINDNMTAIDTAVKALQNAAIMPGMMVTWSGYIADIPPNWKLCDGQFNTPNLTHSFIRAVSTQAEMWYAGGADSIVLVADQLPTHYHGILIDTSSAGTHTHTGAASAVGDHTHAPWSGGNFLETGIGGTTGWAAGGTFSPTHAEGTTGLGGAHSHFVSTDPNGSHYHSISGVTQGVGSNLPVNIMPKYYNMAIIMYLPGV